MTPGPGGPASSRKASAYLKSGRPAGDPEVRDLVRRWDEIGSMFHAAEETKTAARTMWQENSSELGSALPWPADQLRDLVGYLQRARTPAEPMFLPAARGISRVFGAAAPEFTGVLAQTAAGAPQDGETPAANVAASPGGRPACRIRCR